MLFRLMVCEEVVLLVILLKLYMLLNVMFLIVGFRYLIELVMCVRLVSWLKLDVLVGLLGIVSVLKGF